MGIIVSNLTPLSIATTNNYSIVNTVIVNATNPTGGGNAAWTGVWSYTPTANINVETTGGRSVVSSNVTAFVGITLTFTATNSIDGTTDSVTFSNNFNGTTASSGSRKWRLDVNLSDPLFGVPVPTNTFETFSMIHELACDLMIGGFSYGGLDFYTQDDIYDTYYQAVMLVTDLLNSVAPSFILASKYENFRTVVIDSFNRIRRSLDVVTPVDVDGNITNFLGLEDYSAIIEITSQYINASRDAI